MDDIAFLRDLLIFLASGRLGQPVSEDNRAREIALRYGRGMLSAATPHAMRTRADVDRMRDAELIIDPQELQRILRNNRELPRQFVYDMARVQGYNPFYANPLAAAEAQTRSKN